MPPDQPRLVEFTARLRAGESLRIEPTGTGVDDKGQNVSNIGVRDFTGAGLALQWVDMEGPPLEQWPPASLQQIFGDIPQTPVIDPKKKQKPSYTLTPADPKASAQQTIERFAARAFRRPLESGEADRFLKLATDELDEGRLLSRQCRSRSAPCSPRRSSCFPERRRASSTLTPSLSGFPTSSGARCRTMNCWRSRRKPS